MCLEALREGLSCFSERLGVWQETIVFNKAAPEHLDVKFRSKFNHACLHYFGHCYGVIIDGFQCCGNLRLEVL